MLELNSILRNSVEQPVSQWTEIDQSIKNGYVGGTCYAAGISGACMTRYFRMVPASMRKSSALSAQPSVRMQ